MAATAEAAETYWQLAQVRPEAFLPDLAGSLTTLGIRPSELGRSGGDPSRRWPPRRRGDGKAISS